MKQVFIYTRVSTLDQNTELQKRELLEYCQRQAWEVVEVFEDKLTGTNMNRPALKEMNERLWKNEADIVIVFKLDRIFRSLKDAILLLQEWADRGIEFVSLRDPGLNMTTPSGKLMLHMIAAFAEFEASLIKMRVRAGLDNAKAKGKKLGRPKTMDVAKVHQLRQLGWSLSEIARELKTTKSGVSKTLAKYPFPK